MGTMRRAAPESAGPRPAPGVRWVQGGCKRPHQGWWSKEVKSLLQASLSFTHLLNTCGMPGSTPGAGAADAAGTNPVPTLRCAQNAYCSCLLHRNDPCEPLSFLEGGEYPTTLTLGDELLEGFCRSSEV